LAKKNGRVKMGAAPATGAAPMILLIYFLAKKNGYGLFYSRFAI